MAAKSCRRKKLQELASLQTEVEELKTKRDSLLAEHVGYKSTMIREI